MDTTTATPTVFWTMLALAQSPCHTYGIAHRIAGLSLMGFRPSPQRVKRAVDFLVRRGYIACTGSEPSIASARYSRSIYEPTQHGWLWLRAELVAYRYMIGTADRLITRHDMRQFQLNKANELARQFTNQAGL